MPMKLINLPSTLVTFSEDINEGSRLQNVVSFGREGGGEAGGNVREALNGLSSDKGFNKESFFATIDSKLKSCSMSELKSEKDKYYLISCV